MSDFDMRFMRLHGIDPTGAAQPVSEQPQDPFGLQRAGQEATAPDPFGLNRAEGQAHEDRYAAISDIVANTSPAFSVPELPFRTPATEQTFEAPKLELGNWREAVARQEEEKFLNTARAAAVIAIESSGLFQEKALEDVMHQQQEEVQRDKSYDPHTGKKKSRKSLIAEAMR
jgi:hypothetical protein